jgi:antitoxin VapB
MLRQRVVDAAVRRLAKLPDRSLTETIREAVEREYEPRRKAIPPLDRLRPIQERSKALSKPGGLPADEAY